jgi:hypothetical protein
MKIRRHDSTHVPDEVSLYLVDIRSTSIKSEFFTTGADRYE